MINDKVICDRCKTEIPQHGKFVCVKFFECNAKKGYSGYYVSPTNPLDVGTEHLCMNCAIKIKEEMKNV